MKKLLLISIALLLAIVHSEAGDNLVVKGLSIGMPFDDAVAIYNEKFQSAIGKPAKIEKNENNGTFRLCPKDEFYFGFVCIDADSEKKVTKIFFSGNFAGKIFEASDFEPKEFALALCEAYKIDVSKVEYFSGEPDKEANAFKMLLGGYPEPSSGWKYRSDAGYKLIIGEDKSILIQAATKTTETSFN